MGFPVGPGKHNQASLNRCKRPSASHQVSPGPGCRCEHQGWYQSTINRMVPNAMMMCISGQIEAGNFFETAWRWGGVAERPLWATFCINPNPDPTWPLLLLSGFLWPRRVCGHFAGMRGFIAACQLEEEEDPSMEMASGGKLCGLAVRRQ